MTREEYEEKIDERIKALRIEQSAVINIKLDNLKKELMSEYKEEEPSLDGWKVGDKYYVRFDGREIHTETIVCDDKGKIYDFDIFNIKHGYAKHTAEEVQFQMERDAVLYELSKYAEPEDVVWDGYDHHWYICWNYSEDRIGLDYKYNSKHNDTYFALREDAEKAIKAVGESRIRKYYLMVGDDE